MDNLSITPDSINEIEDLCNLPFLDKKIILSQGIRLLNTDVKEKDMIVKHTSGSSGTPKALYFDKGTALREWANVLHLWKRAGYKWDSSRMVLRDVHFRAIDKGIHYQWDAMRRELCVDIHDMSDENCIVYCEQIEKYKPEFMHGYPSAIFQL